MGIAAFQQFFDLYANVLTGDFVFESCLSSEWRWLVGVSDILC